MTAANMTWNFYNSTGPVTGTLTAAWAPGGGSTIDIGNTNAGTLFTNGNKINRSGAGTVTLNVKSTGTLNIGTTSVFGTGVTLVPAASSTVIYSVSGATISNVAYSNLSFTANNTLGITTVNGTFTNSATSTISSLALSVGSVVNTGTLSMSAGGTNLTVNTDFDNTTGSFSLGSSSHLTINGTITSLGTITGDGTGFLVNAGSSSANLNMNQTTSGTTNSMFEIQNTGSGSIFLTNALFIAPGGDITAASGTIDVTTSGGSLTLLADQATVGNTGAIGSIGGTFIATSVTSQVFHNPSGNMTDWTLMGSPGIVGQNFTSWNAAFPITCLNCPDGYYPGGTAFGSITSYVEASDTYPEITNTTDAMTVGQGWWVYMGNSSPGTSTSGELLSVTGPPNLSSPFSFGVTAGGTGAGYNLVSNPYPSPISWTSVQSNNAANIGSSYYVWSPNTGTNSSFDASSGVGNPLSGSYALGDVIPTGMGFYVLASSGPSIDFSEADKTQGTQPLLRQSSQAVQKNSTPAFSIQASGNGMTSEAVIAFLSPFTTGLDSKGDTRRYGTTAGYLELSTVVAGANLAINVMPDLTQNYSVPVRMASGTTGAYQINGLNLNRLPSGACLILHDNYSGQDYDLRQGSHSITLNDTENVARFTLNITIASLSITSNVVQTSCPSSSNGYITAIGNNAGPWNYTWKDANNNIVKTSLNKPSADSLLGLTTGVYKVDVNTVSTCDNVTQTFTVSAGSQSALSVTTNSVLATCSTINNGYITAVGNNAGPWNYTWKDANSNVVKSSLNLSTLDSLTGLSGGMYSVDISTVGGCDYFTQTFSFVMPNTPISDFTLASLNVNVNSIVSFTNTSTDASDFWWTFGDGGTSNLQNPTYSYSMIGTNTVTLYAFNPTCNDTASFQQVINVQATTGITSNTSSEIVFSKDQNGTYVKFNYGSQTRVNVNVYNALGQAILVNVNQMVTNDKIYLNLDNAKDQLIFVNVSNLDKNTQTTKKLFNN